MNRFLFFHSQALPLVYRLTCWGMTYPTICCTIKFYYLVKFYFMIVPGLFKAMARSKRASVQWELVYPRHFQDGGRSDSHHPAHPTSSRESWSDRNYFISLYLEKRSLINFIIVDAELCIFAGCLNRGEDGQKLEVLAKYWMFRFQLRANCVLWGNQWCNWAVCDQGITAM